MAIKIDKPSVPPNVNSDSLLASSLGFNAFTSDRKPFNVLTNYDSIKDNIRNILFFRKGDYLDNSDFGVGIQDYTFDQKEENLKMVLAQEIRRQISKYEPRAIIRMLNVSTPSWADDSVIVDMDFLINNVPFSTSATGSGGFTFSQSQRAS